ncbi:Inositol-1-monophosphatase [termite gut metagenome]|uniref:inositol-phosphate phosphatase n=1 Tax=termite gut metagenome TaxID=433724 RepID=A0A5J4S5G0_9ZZZZ
MLNLCQLTSSVREIAVEAGQFLRRERKEFHRECVIEKQTHDYVSYVDKESERLVVERLSALLPEAGFITEEGSALYSGEEYCWVIDPLDGTTNYIHDNAPYCVSIALRSRTELLVGVVYEVCRGECYYAWKGGKAYLNGEQIHVSDVRDVENSFLQLELPYNYQDYGRTIEYVFHELYGKASSIRINGSSAMSLCYVAAGRFEGWMEAYIGKWDFSAGALIVMEAGGQVTDFTGNKHFIDGHHIIATNGYLHQPLLQLLKVVPPKL